MKKYKNYLDYYEDNYIDKGCPCGENHFPDAPKKVWKTRYDVFALIGILIYSALVVILLDWVFRNLII